MNNKKFGDILIEEKFIDKEELEKALKYQKDSDKKLGEILLEQRILSDEQITKTLEIQGYPRLDSLKVKVDKEFLKKANTEILVDNVILPIKIVNEVLWVVTSSPENLPIIDKLERVYDTLGVHVFVDSRKNIKKKIKEIFPNVEFYSPEEDIEEINQEELEEQLFLEDSPLVKLVDDIIIKGINKGASDIHVEPRHRENSLVRYRIDGDLIEGERVPKKWKHHVVARMKVMANIDISKKLEPQDGEIEFEYLNKTTNIRVNTLPLIDGEKVVLRILGQSSSLVELEELGFTDEKLDMVKKKIIKRQGIIICTGPTGSGKTTTLYSILSRINDPSKNISTIEDPVEISLTGINQSQITKKMDFTDVLRALLRQDPDIIMVGEVRDKASAGIAIKASLTGHLLLTTMHTNSAIGVVTRLVDMGIEPYLVADALELVISQRLVRKLCPYCKVTSEEDLRKAERILPNKFDDSDILYKSVGCDKCNNIGYKGRLAIHEIFIPNDKCRDFISNKDVEALKAISDGRTLIDDAIEKVKMGVTSLKEIIDKAGIEY